MIGKIKYIRDGANIVLPKSVSSAVKCGDITLFSFIESLSGWDMYYISASYNGNVQDGSKEHPYSNIEAAMNVIEDSESSVVCFVLYDGEYHLSSTIQINSEKEIIFIGCGDNVIVDSLCSVPTEAIGNGVFKTINGGFSPNMIWVDGKVRQIASTCNLSVISSVGGVPSSTLNNGGGFSSTLDDENYSWGIITCSSEDIAILKQYKDSLWFKVFFNWTAMRYKIGKFDDVNNTFSFKIYQNPSGQGSLTPSQFSKIIFENIPERLSLANKEKTFNGGNFWYDSDGYVYYKRYGIEDCSHIDIPLLSNLMTINTPSKFINIKFRGSRYDFFDAYDGKACSDTQSAYSITPSIIINGENVVFKDCEFSYFDNTCIGMNNNSKNCIVESCYFHNLGCSSIRVGETNTSSREIPAEGSTVPTNCLVENCVITHIGELHPQSAGLIMTFAKGCKFLHNDISLCYYTGITSGHVWGDSATAFEGCVIGFNKVHHINGDKMSDLGGIYNLGSTKGLRVVGNVVSWIKGTASQGLYLDEGTKDSVWSNNIVYNCTRGVQFHACRRNNFKNNILVKIECGIGGFVMYVQNTNSINNNIMCYSNGRLFRDASIYSNYENNCFFATDGKEQNITIASEYITDEPNFVDYENDDYRLIDDSVSSQIDFINIVNNAGVNVARMKSIVSSYESDFAAFENITKNISH